MRSVRIDPAQLDHLLHPMLDPDAELDSSPPGSLPHRAPPAAGRVRRGHGRGRGPGEEVILVRSETAADDIHGLDRGKGHPHRARRHGLHAAVVARGMGKPCVAGLADLAIDLERRICDHRRSRGRRGRRITIDGAHRSVMLGAVELVTGEDKRRLETILGWADGVRRLEVHANADTPADAAKARELGAQGIGLCRTEHMFLGEERLPVVQEMILADDEAERRAALDRLLPFQQPDFEGIFEAMAGLPVTIRLLDPPLHEFLPSLDEATDERMRERIEHCTRRTRCSARAAAGSASNGRRSTRCRSGRSSAPPSPSTSRTGQPPHVEIMHPLVAFGEELRRLRELTMRTADEEACDIPYLIGTMIELPRACVRADEIARHADFFSFGTNDLTQTALGFSRDDAEGKFLTRYLEDGVLAHDPFATLDQEGVGELMRMAVERGRSLHAGLTLGICGEHGGDPRRCGSATSSASTTSPAPPIACRSLGWRRRRRRWPTLAPEGTSSQAASRRTIRFRVVALPAVWKPHGRMRSRPRRRAGKRASATSIPLVVSPPQHYERIRGCPSIREPRRT